MCGVVPDGRGVVQGAPVDGKFLEIISRFSRSRDFDFPERTAATPGSMKCGRLFQGFVGLRASGALDHLIN